MPNINKLLYDLIQRVDRAPKKAIRIGIWRLCPDRMVTWKYDDAKRQIYVVFQSSNMGYQLNNEEEYQKAKTELDNYQF